MNTLSLADEYVIVGRWIRIRIWRQIQASQNISLFI